MVFPGQPDFWGQPDATVWFGEPKFACSPYVAEACNTVSSLAYVVTALDLFGRRPRGHAQQPLHALALFLVGLSSALFHASGRRWAQLLDELSMILWTSCVLHSLGQFGPGLLLFTLAVLAHYLVDAHFVLFLVVFSAHVLQLLRAVGSMKSLTAREKLGTVLTFALAAGCWVIEQAARPSLWQLHAAWHFWSAAAACLLHEVVEHLTRTG